MATATQEKKKKTYKARNTRPELADVLEWAGDQINGLTDACLNVPGIGPCDFDNLVSSIAADGLIEPIRLDSNRNVIDGRSRLMAAFALGMELDEESYRIVEDYSPETIASTNYCRRHLTISQRIMYATEKLKAEKEAAKERKRAGGELGRKNKQAKSLGSDPVPSQSSKQKRAKRALEVIAESEGVPREGLRVADRVASTDPELAQQVKIGTVTLSEAAERLEVDKPAKSSNQLRKTHKRIKSPEKLFRGQAIEIMQYGDNAILTQFDHVFVCSHAKQLVQFIAYRDERVWKVGKTGSSEWTEVEDEVTAKNLLLAHMTEHLQRSSDPSEG